MIEIIFYFSILFFTYLFAQAIIIFHSNLSIQNFSFLVRYRNYNTDLHTVQGGNDIISTSLSFLPSDKECWLIYKFQHCASELTLREARKVACRKYINCVYACKQVFFFRNMRKVEDLGGLLNVPETDTLCLGDALLGGL